MRWPSPTSTLKAPRRRRRPFESWVAGASPSRPTSPTTPPSRPWSSKVVDGVRPHRHPLQRRRRHPAQGRHTHRGAGSGRVGEAVQAEPHRYHERHPGSGPGHARAELRGDRQHRLGEHAPVRHGRGNVRHVQVRAGLFTKQLAYVEGPSRHPRQLRRPRSGSHQFRRHPARRRTASCRRRRPRQGGPPSWARSPWDGSARPETSPTPPCSSPPMSPATPPDRCSTCPVARSCRRRPTGERARER